MLITAIGVLFRTTLTGAPVRPSENNAPVADEQGIGCSGRVQVLITRRPDDTVLGGYWEFPGGKIEPGETPEQCLVREFREEVGLPITVGERLTVLSHRYDHATVELHAYACRLVVGSQPKASLTDASARGGMPQARNLQVAAHQWLSIADLSDVRFPPANAPLVDLLIERFSG